MAEGQKRSVSATDPPALSSDQVRQLIWEEMAATAAGPSTSSPGTSAGQSSEALGQQSNSHQA